MKEAQAIATLRRIGEDVIAIADYLVEYYGRPVEREPAAQEATTTQESTTAQEPVEGEPVARAITLDEVRTELSKLSRAGKKELVKKLLSEFGAVKLSDVDPKDYWVLMAKAQEEMASTQEAMPHAQ